MLTHQTEALVVTVDDELREEELVSTLKTEGARVGPFRLVLEIPDDVQVTLEMARVWLDLVLDPLLPLTGLVVASALVPAHLLTQAVMLVARRRGVVLPIEVYKTTQSALNAMPPLHELGEHPR